MILDNLVSSFLRSRERGTGGSRRRARPRTIQFYQWELKHFTGFMHERGIVEYEDIKRKDVIDYLDWMNGLTSWGEASRYKNLRALRAFSRWIQHEEDWLEGGLKPFHHYLPSIPKTPVRKFVPSRRELKRFMEAVNTRSRAGHRDHVVMQLLLDTGMRIGEVALLILDHLKLPDCLIVVPELGKTGTRLVPITDRTAKLLKGWLRRRQSFAKCEYVFVSNDGGPSCPNLYEQAWAKYRQRSGVKGITPHTFRHCFCTYFLEKGGDIAKLKAITGHSSYEMLNAYLNLGGEALQEELERVNPAAQVASAF